ncbi:iron(III) transport system ATP-binding protein [Oceanicella actignis]|nr:iron(III) transport system ATP-binding protein [Oceanicella actignis]
MTHDIENTGGASGAAARAVEREAQDGRADEASAARARSEAGPQTRAHPRPELPAREPAHELAPRRPARPAAPPLLAPPRLALAGLRKDYDGRRVVDDVSLEVEPGELVCLLGPSGCGKSTTLRIAAGVERQDAGTVALDGRVVSDGVRHAPPEARSIGLMFQDFALFPHLTVAQNVAFGLPRARAAEAETYLRRVGLGGYGDKFPHMLSGGEQQRVALARALAPRPRVMLMDEPFSGLDQRLRDEIRDDTLSVLKEEGTGVLLVTHEPEEAMRMADRIALMRGGRIVQVGAPYHIYNHPADLEAAAFFSDVNVIRAVVRSRQTDTPFGLFLTPDLPDGAEVEIVIRPQHLRIELDRGQPAPRESAEHGVPAYGRVERARFMGSESLIEARMEHDGAILRATTPGAFLPERGTGLWLSMRRDRCFLFPARPRAGA